MVFTIWFFTTVFLGWLPALAACCVVLIDNDDNKRARMWDRARLTIGDAGLIFFALALLAGAVASIAEALLGTTDSRGDLTWLLISAATFSVVGAVVAGVMIAMRPHGPTDVNSVGFVNAQRLSSGLWIVALTIASIVQLLA